MKLNKPLFWDYQKVSMWSFLLLPFSFIYLAIFWSSRIIKSFKTYKKPPIKVICVGNIYLGGTGKTPLVREIYKIAKSLGKNPAFIKKYHSYVSDEIKMLSNSGKIFTGNKRYNDIISSYSSNHDVAILDDGFQDFSINPDLSILCFNSIQMIGNGLVIPSGPLREKLSSILRAKCIFINGEKNLKFEERLRKIIGDRKIHIFYSKYKIKNIEKFKNKEIVAFAGIGNPSNFFDLLRQNNLKIRKTYSFPDHYDYKKKDFDNIYRDTSAKIITTEKDFYRMSDTQKQKCDYVEIELKIQNKDEFIKIIKSYL